ncbi:MAG: RHS repeat-associated core domain-containing protein [Clostridia bacterium]|nr:RHS repeat-associated core domain-containing protein [Clostridia bacterium]
MLTSYNGTFISYDTIGNPTTIGSAQLTWKGRQLQSYSPSFYYSTSFTYNADGIRTSKTYSAYYSDTRHEYTLDGSQIVKETVFSNNVEQYCLVYLYDENGAPIGFRYRTPNYAKNVFDGFFFEKNIQGDIIGIWDQSGTKIVSYTYDAWGNMTVSGTGASTIGSKNPFRYRGYYYDTETGLYYLQTRYYNPIWGRFINADRFVNGNSNITGFCGFAYCSNNPIRYVDPRGEWVVFDWIADKANEIGNWFSNTFGAAVYNSNSYDPISVETFFCGCETGICASSVIVGDNSKPITFFAQKASDWWKLWEYKIGVSCNIGKGGFSYGFGVCESTIAISANDTTVELDWGPLKIGLTEETDACFSEHSAGWYTHYYVRPWSVGVAVACVFCTCGAAAIPVVAALLN